jgi:hypothetical protein
MTVERFRTLYEAWGTPDQLAARLAAVRTEVDGERVIVAGFPLGHGIEWTLRLASDRPSFAADVVVIEVS